MIFCYCLCIHIRPLCPHKSWVLADPCWAARAKAPSNARLSSRLRGGKCEVHGMLAQYCHYLILCVKFIESHPPFILNTPFYGPNYVEIPYIHLHPPWFLGGVILGGRDCSNWILDYARKSIRKWYPHTQMYIYIYIHHLMNLGLCVDLPGGTWLIYGIKAMSFVE